MDCVSLLHTPCYDKLWAGLLPWKGRVDALNLRGCHYSKIILCFILKIQKDLLYIPAVKMSGPGSAELFGDSHRAVTFFHRIRILCHFLFHTDFCSICHHIKSIKTKSNFNVYVFRFKSAFLGLMALLCLLTLTNMFKVIILDIT